MPEILPGHCTHERSPLATCNNCIEVCPNAALSHGKDGSLILDASRCDECGLCVASCPEAVLTAHLSEPLYDGKLAFLACEPASGRPGDGVLPCLHAASDQMLADIGRRGIRQIKIAYNDCASCARYSHIEATLEKRLSAINSALASCGLQTISIEHVEIENWLQRTTDLYETTRRRRFFSDLLKHPAATILPSGASGMSGNAAAAIGVFLSGQGAAIVPNSLVVNFKRCTLCGACAALCAHKAIEFHIVEKIGIFSIAPEHCTNCKLCQDVCLDKAITITKWQAPTEPSLTFLDMLICNRCHHVFWQQAKSLEIATCCPVCQKSGGKAPNRLVED